MRIISMAIAFVIAVLSGMGVGGGGLFVIYLALFTDTPQLAAQGMNLLFFLFSAGASLPVHWTRRRIYTSAVLFMALFGVVGALIGTGLTQQLPAGLLRKIFGVLLVVSGLLSLKKKDMRAET